MKRIAAALCLVVGLFGSVIAPGPADAAPPDFTETDCEGVSDSIFRLYTAALGRTAEEVGYDFWLEEYQAGRFGLVRAAGFFVTSDEFRSSYGSLDNRAFVEQLYRNVLGRPGEPSGVDFWTGELDSGSRDRALLLLDFSESPENVTNTETRAPSLGFFNRGLDGPWTCNAQPPANTCTTSDSGIAGIRIDFTIEIPPSANGPDARASVRVDIARNGAVERTQVIPLSGVVGGERVSHVATIPGLAGPASELTCSISSVSAGVPAPPDNPGDIDGSSCVFVANRTTSGIETAVFAVTSPNPGDQLATGNAVVELRVDGFRVAESPVSLNTPTAGAAGEGMTSFLADLIPDAIDMRRVACAVVAATWN